MPGLFLPLKFDGLAALDVGIAHVISAVQEAAVVGAAAGGEVMAQAWRDNVETILIHGYATGEYYDSITVGEPIVDKFDVEVEVYTEAEAHGESYPTDLEYGTSKIPGGYPTMTPAFESSQDAAVAAVAAAEADALAMWKGV